MRSSVDRARRNALLESDSELGMVANKLRPLDQKWLDKLAASYLAIDDKNYRRLSRRAGQGCVFCFNFRADRVREIIRIIPILTMIDRRVPNRGRRWT
jgi:hypothetical protein